MSLILPDRYTDLGPLGAGGMGVVHRVEDHQLRRVVVMKLLKAALSHDPENRSRFLGEAQLTAQLTHPGVVPVHELGELADGRPFFTMDEVRGRTLAQVLADHPPPLRRLIDVLHRIGETVGYAHARGVVHRDIKPANLMLGAHGQVLVMDWGLGKVVGDPEAAWAARILVPPSTDRSEDDSDGTQQGVITGTPAYMSPEQAFGELKSLGPRSDVYSLGAVLYQVLCGQKPYAGHPHWVVLQVREGEPPPLPAHAGDEELRRITERAMARDPADRFDDAREWAHALQAWLEGARRREQALGRVAEARKLQPRVDSLRAAARQRRADARLLLAEVPDHADEAAYYPAWDLEAQGDQLDQEALRLSRGLVRTLDDALQQDPTVGEAHQALADHYQQLAAEADSEGRSADAHRYERLVRDHDQGAHAAWLTGDGTLVLETDPPGATVHLDRIVEVRRRLVAEPDRVLGTTPLEATLPEGRYLLRLQHPERAEVRYPVRVDRLGTWRGPVVPLPHPEDLGPEDRYVPPGPALLGGDADEEGQPPTARVVPGFVVRQHPVTNGELITFLNALVDAGQREEAEHHSPRTHGGSEGRLGTMVLRQDADGHFLVGEDAEGDLWYPNAPAMMVDFHGASAYAAWHAERTGQPWRLPTEAEWEKAARGVDGRRYVWGEHLVPTWCRNLRSLPTRPLPARIDEHPQDVSIYGVCGLAGNSRDWCTDVSHGDIERRVVRGGGWDFGLTRLRTTTRSEAVPWQRASSLGFRLVRSYPSADGKA